MTDASIQFNFGIIETIISVLIFLAALFSAWYSLKYKVENLDSNLKSFKDEIKDCIKSLTNGTVKHDKQIGIMTFKLNEIWKDRSAPAHSPRALNEFGKKILEDSGIKIEINKRLDEFYNAMVEKKPENAYQIQEYSEKLMYKLKNEPQLKSFLEDAAFKTGSEIDSVLFVGSIYLRDLLLEKFGYKGGDIDQHDPANSNKINK